MRNYIEHKSFIKKILIVTLIVFATQTLILGKLDNKGYQELIVQCQAIRLRILQENDFNVIRQNTLRSLEQDIVPTLTERFTSMGKANSSRPSAFASQLGSARVDLESRLNALQVEHTLNLNIIIVNTITAFLMTINTEASKSLLAQLIANGFKF